MSDPVTPPMPAEGSAAKVLIVEDNELNARLFKDLLEAHGYLPVHLADPQNIEDVLRTEKPDLILMDIQLPEISGLDLTKQLKEQDDFKHIPVIAVTAFAMKGDSGKVLSGGCEDYISKPISVVQFIETVRKYI